MPSATQQVFKKIVLHNKLLPEAELDKLLVEVPDPEQAIQRLIERAIVPAKMAGQLLSLYRKQVDLLMADFAGASDVKPAKPAAAGDTAAAGPPVSGPGAANQSGAHRIPIKPVAATIERQQSTPIKQSTPGQKPTARDVRPAPPKSTGEKPGTPAPRTAGIQIDHLQGRHGADLILGLFDVTRQAGASDLHIMSGMKPAVRIAGTLRDLPMSALDPNECEKALLEILDEPQRESFLRTNDIDFCYDGGPELGRFRANLLRQHRGVDGAFRPIPSRVPSFEELKLPDVVKRFADYRVGIVLVTGPKGCGKTTTLAAMVDLINSTRGDHIITLEDPIEFVHPSKRGHVNQRQVGMHTRSFSNALRAALREAPDVILVGEMRDLETTSLAITAAETGHLVLATLHTPDALRTIGRVLDVFPAKEQGQIRAMLSESLRGIVSQQLIPRADGTGMELALEILVNTPAIGHLIREERVFQIPGLMQTGRKLGMRLMDESLVALVRQGRISRDEALSLAHESALFEKELARPTEPSPESSGVA